jgi:hypothetical protein
MTFKHKYQKNNVHLEQFVTQTLKSYAFPTLYLKHISVVEPVTTVEETYNVRNIHILACFIK